MIILGLTGSIGMGKTHAARALRRLGLPVFDADGAVRALMARGDGAVAAVEAAFPGVVREGGVDRGALSERVFGDREALARLEAILHPLVREAELGFLHGAARRRARLVVLDIPLLFETGADRLCDATVLVTAPAFVQELRVLRRAGMTGERLAAIRACQMPESEKRRRADFIVRTGLDRGRTLRQLRRIVTLVEERYGRGGGAWPHRAVKAVFARRAPVSQGRAPWGRAAGGL